MTLQERHQQIVTRDKPMTHAKEGGSTSRGQRGDIWFPAKTYGLGWGPPITWQGWGVLLGWMLLYISVVCWLAMRQQIAALLFYSTLMVGILIAICWWKGEALRWRWGRK